MRDLVHEGLCSLHFLPLVTRPPDTNPVSMDTQWLQQAIWEQDRVRTVRCTLAEIAGRGSLDASGQLRVDDSVVAVAYYRAGYSPNDYPTDVEWRARCDTPLHDT